MRVLAVDNVSLSVQEPSGDLILGRVLDDGDDSLQLFNSQFTSSLAEIDVGLLAHQVSISSANTSDGGQGVHDFDFSIDVCRQQSENMLEVSLLGDYERHDVCCGRLSMSLFVEVRDMKFQSEGVGQGFDSGTWITGLGK